MIVKRIYCVACLLLIIACHLQAQSKSGKSISFYQTKLQDTSAIYFTPENYNIKTDGKTDVSAALQEAIRSVKVKYNFGIVFIPEGNYLISQTIYIPQAIRLIGYGKNRPLIILQKNAPGFQVADTADKGKRIPSCLP